MQFRRRLVGGKMPTRLDDLAQLHVHALDGETSTRISQMILS